MCRSHKGQFVGRLLVACWSLLVWLLARLFVWLSARGMSVRRPFFVVSAEAGSERHLCSVCRCVEVRRTCRRGGSCKRGRHEKRPRPSSGGGAEQQAWPSRKTAATSCRTRLMEGRGHRPSPPFFARTNTAAVWESRPGRPGSEEAIGRAATVAGGSYCDLPSRGGEP